MVWRTLTDAEMALIGGRSDVERTGVGAVSDAIDAAGRRGAVA